MSFTVLYFCLFKLFSFLGKNTFPEDLTTFYCSRTQIRQFAEEAKELGVLVFVVGMPLTL